MGRQRERSVRVKIKKEKEKKFYKSTKLNQVVIEPQIAFPYSSNVEVQITVLQVQRSEISDEGNALVVSLREVSIAVLRSLTRGWYSWKAGHMSLHLALRTKQLFLWLQTLAADETGVQVRGELQNIPSCWQNAEEEE